MAEPSDDEILVTKWLLVGGVLWDSNTSRGDSTTPRPTRWFAITPGDDEHNSSHNTYGRTPVEAIRKYLDEYRHTEGHEWLEPLLEHVRSSTPSCRGPT